MTRPIGSNADEWALFLSEHPIEYAAVQIAEAIEGGEAERDTLRVENAVLQLRATGNALIIEASQAAYDTLALQVVGLREALTALLAMMDREDDSAGWRMADVEAQARQALASSTPSNLLAYVEIGKLAVAAHKAGANWNEVQGGDWGEIMEAASAKLRAADEALSKACTSIIEKERVDAAND